MNDLNDLNVCLTFLHRKNSRRAKRKLVKELTFFETATWFGMVGGAKIGRHGLANGEHVFAISPDTGEVEKQVGKVLDANLKNVVTPFVKKTKKTPFPRKYLRPTSYIVPPHASTTKTITKLTPSGAQIEPNKHSQNDTLVIPVTIPFAFFASPLIIVASLPTHDKISEQDIIKICNLINFYETGD